MPTLNLTFPNGGKSTVNTDLFINNKWVPALDGKTFATINPTTGKEIGQVAEASAKDIDVAVKAARAAYETSWGEKVPGFERGKLLLKLAEIVEANLEELANIESLDNGKAVAIAKAFDASEVAACLRYYAGWADKNQGKTIEVNDTKFTYTRHEPIGVCGQIIPWNFPLLMFAWKIAPALATGNVVVLKTAEQTPLSAYKMCEFIAQAGIPPGVVNVVSGFGPVAGAAIAKHMDIDKVAFTGSTLVGRNIMKNAAETNLKKVTLELGGKSPNIIFKDADLEVAAKWAAFGIMFNMGQCCCAGSRVYVEEEIYDQFMEVLEKVCKSLPKGDPFQASTFLGPQISQLQQDRIMAYIDSGKKDGAKVRIGGSKGSGDGYFVEPTIFTDVNPDSKIAREEIFGPVVVCSKFKDEADLLRIANDSMYGLAAAVFSRDVSRAIGTAHKLNAGTVWVNCYNQLNSQVPFGGYKASGIGRELGEYALTNYTNVKAVHVNLTIPCPL
ncbi:putative Iad1-indole-3-acetaldehyde dehydrogenase [Violaceomyces palustris]|uniref:Iad1-indole-3-acetaldehyde dehydrogenase n=1 Tax=Violaceomyces palustris TaxID=1673888 RepID=A0ACD0P8N5_9BASI|nr:putative Iad1-indole-3-acetaldehyde dehydrogenase [Violaceomyces palustris]